MSEKSRNRLLNWKFRQAWYVISDEGDDSPATDEEKEIIHSLAELFVNVGYGLDGAMGNVVDALVQRLVKESDPVDGSSEGSRRTELDR